MKDIAQIVIYHDRITAWYSTVMLTDQIYGCKIQSCLRDDEL